MCQQINQDAPEGESLVCQLLLLLLVCPRMSAAHGSGAYFILTHLTVVCYKMQKAKVLFLKSNSMSLVHVIAATTPFRSGIGLGSDGLDENLCRHWCK